ncbi:hypothetical protein RJ035_003580 [Blastomyces gilchristii]
MEMNSDEKTLRQIERELDTKIYPGTEIMTDVGSHQFVKCSDRVLVPQPSQEPSDPLNWSPFWKACAMFLSTAVTFTQAFGPMALAPMFPQLIQEFDTDLAGGPTANMLWKKASADFVHLGVFNRLNVERPCHVLWEFHGRLHFEWLWGWSSRDIMFLHERGAYNTLYFTFYFGALVVSPVIGGSMAHHLNWCDFWWLNVGLLGFVLVLLVFLFPETRWPRSHPVDPVEGTRVADETTAAKADSTATSSAKPSTESDIENEHAYTDPYLRKGRPSLRQFRLFSMVENPVKSLLLDFWIPWKLHLFPIVHLAAFIVSWSASVFLVVNVTQSQLFAAPPYNFNSQTVGFFNFAVIVGNGIGLATNGYLSDWISMRATKKNRGIREPEMRLPAMIPYVIIMIIGNFVVAFGYEYKWDWKIIVIIGYTAVGIQVAALPAIASTYAVDSYKPIAGSIFVTITVNKNLWGYGLSEIITPWTQRNGFIPAIMLNMGLTTFFCAWGIVFYYYGKRLRKITANSKVHQM